MQLLPQKVCNLAHFSIGKPVYKINKYMITSVIVTHFKVCIGCIAGTTCCGRVWGRCVCWRPRWNGCCRTVSDPVCVATNAACNAFREPIRAALRSAEALVGTTRRTLGVANAAISGLQRAVTVAQQGVSASRVAVSAVRTAHAAGLQAADLISRLTINSLIRIREISFNVSLATAAGGSFSGSITASFGGATERTISLNINLHNITSMARELASHIGNGLPSLFT